MHRLRPILLAVVVLIGPAVYAAETVSQCRMNCPYRGIFRDEEEEPCAKCCRAQAKVEEDKCTADCATAERKCRDELTECKSIPDPDQRWYCEFMKGQPCRDAFGSCRSRCFRTDWQIAGGCPGEVPPKPCEKECWRWDIRTKRCEGPPTCGGRGR